MINVKDILRAHFFSSARITRYQTMPKKLSNFAAILTFYTYKQKRPYLNKHTTKHQQLRSTSFSQKATRSSELSSTDIVPEIEGLFSGLGLEGLDVRVADSISDAVTEVLRHGGPDRQLPSPDFGALD